MSTLHIQLLGDFRLVFGDVPVTTVNTLRVQSFLVYLVLHCEAPQSRQHLAFLLWPDSTEAQARTNLRYVLHQLRQALPDADRFVHADTRTLRWQPDAGFTVDVAEFEGAIAQAEQAEGSAAVQMALEQAVTLYRGDLLPGCYDDWIMSQRERLRQMFIRALEQLTLLLEEQGDYRAAIRHAQRLLLHDPLHEVTYRRLMRLYAAIGDRARAVRVYHTCATVLQRELGVEPSAATREAYERLLLGVEEGGSGAAEEKSRPPPGPSAPLHNLPVQLTSFIGREEEMAEVRRMLASTRLLTLTGPGGCGKTRLALQVAADLLPGGPRQKGRSGAAAESSPIPFQDGVWWVDLAALTDAALVPQAVVSTLGLREQAGRAAAQMLSDYLCPRKLLLVFDNCEHLVEACAHLAEALLRTCPHLRIMATSREVLGVAGEVAWVVPPLSFPDPATDFGYFDEAQHRFQISDFESSDRSNPQSYEAVRLFVERATAVLPTFTLTRQNAPAIVQISQRLDGIPLAIELAAARVKVLSPEQIAARLDDRFRLLTGGCRTALPRHRTLRAAIDWSYELLSEQERALFRRLSAFAGGFTLDAAEAVCAGAVGRDAIPSCEVLELLSHLVDKSLVAVVEQERGREVRYRMLETIRHYARDRLVEAGEADIARGCHLDVHLRLVEVAEPRLRTADRERWLQRLDQERDNLRAALEWSRGTPGGLKRGVQLAGALLWFWYFRGYWSEGSRWLEQTIARCTPPAADQGRGPRAVAGNPYLARALFSVGVLAWAQGDCAVARARLEESVSMWRDLGDRQGAAYALAYLAVASRDQGDFASAQLFAAESVTILRELGDRWGLALAMHHLGSVAINDGDYVTARRCNQESLALFRELKDGWGEALPLSSLAHIAMREGDHATARSLFEENLARHREAGDRWHIAHALNGLGEVARCQGDHEEAAVFYQESLAHHRELGNRRGIAVLLHNLGHVALHRGDRRRAAALFRESLALFDELENRQGMIECLAGLAGVASTQGPSEAERAARLFGAVDAWLNATGDGLAPADRAEYDGKLAAVRARLDETTFAAAWAEGQTMTLEQAIEDAFNVQP